MSTTRLQDDLFKDFKEQERFIEEQVKLFDPIAESLSRPAATRLLNKGAMLMLEIICYLLALGTIAFAIFMHKWPPFNTLYNITYDVNLRFAVGTKELWMLNIAVYTLLGIIALLFFILAQNMHTIRKKNAILHKAGKNMRTLVGQLLRRKAAIDTIQQRHFDELPSLPTNVNDIPNPGYGD